MNRYSKIGIVLGGIVCGAWCGDQIVDAQTCAVKCAEIKGWTAKTSAGDTGGKHFYMSPITDECKRHWWTKGGQPYAGILSDVKHYKEVDQANSTCTVDCYRNGSIEGEIQCTSLEQMGDNIDKTCYRECRDTMPGM